MDNRLRRDPTRHAPGPFPRSETKQPNNHMTATTTKTETTTLRMKKKRDCKGSVLFEAIAESVNDLPAMDTAYINRTFVPIGAASVIKITIEVER
jgi:hypothetical protein